MSQVWNKKTVYLTFDDGPTPEVTPWVLSLLDAYQCKATFFCLGNKAEKYPEIVNKIRNSNHKIGIHGYEHLNGWKTNTLTYINNTYKAYRILSSNLFRPPYGKITPIQWYKLKKEFRIVWWTYLSKDFMPNSCNDKFYLKLLKNTRNNSIIVFHDTTQAFLFLNKYLEKYLQWLEHNEFVCSTL